MSKSNYTILVYLRGIKMKSLTVLLTLIFSISAFAESTVEPTTQPVSAKETRGQKQKRRIQEGVNSGALTAGEAAKLQAEQEAIRQARQAYKKSGGKLDANEKKIINDMRDAANQNIRKEKHDQKVVEGSKAAENLVVQPKVPKTPEQIAKAEAKKVEQAALQGELAANAAKQIQRIENGLKTGALTQAEANKLKAEQEAIIKATEAYTKSGGKISRSENQILEDMRKEASGNIRDQKHDDQRDQKQQIEHASNVRELTPKEVEKLMQEQNVIDETKKALKSDGELSDADREILRDMRETASENIQRERKDKQKVKKSSGVAQ